MQIVNPIHQRGIALLRIVVGIIFLWAGLEKLIGTPGGFDAAGFLKFGTAGTLGWPFVADAAKDAVFNPTHGFWTSLAGNPSAMSVINVLVPLGQIGIGVSLITGLFTRFGAAMGALMMLFFFFAAWDFAYGIVNQHLTYLVICLSIAGLGAGRFFGLDGVLADRTSPALRTWIMSGEPEPVTA
jgi:thiosulfate dehydrogenase [quinone] large subunit